MKQTKLVLLLLLLTILLTGCRSFYEGSYSVVMPHGEIQTVSAMEGDVYEVHTYSGMKNAVQNLISTAAESGTIRAIDYPGSVADDISRICLDVSREYPLAAYAVEYITHSASRILGYYEVSVHISYRRSAEEIAAVKREVMLAELYALLEAASINGDSHLAVQIATLAVSEQSLTAYVEHYYRQHPELIAEEPGVSISFYPSEDDVNKIITFRFSYDNQFPQRVERLAQLNRQADELLSDVDELSAEEKLQLCCRQISNAVRDTRNGSTAYDALILGAADSEGCAMAFQFLCNRCAIPCQIVEGKRGVNTRYWNIVRIGQDYFHVDPAYWCSTKLVGTPLRSDADMLGTYWWDVELYPKCRTPVASLQPDDVSGAQWVPSD